MLPDVNAYSFGFHNVRILIRYWSEHTLYVKLFQVGKPGNFGVKFETLAAIQYAE
jgi:hypothetical protein